MICSSGGPSAPYMDDLNNRYDEDSRYNEYTGGLSEDEQIRRATEESRRQMGKLFFTEQQISWLRPNIKKKSFGFSTQ